MRPVTGLLIDIGGVVWQGGAAIPGAAEAVAILREAGLPFRFLTNTTSRPLDDVVTRLGNLGIPARHEDVFTPAVAARVFLARHGLTPHLLVARSLERDFAGLPRDGRPAVVVGDAGSGFSYEALNDAFRRIHAGAEFVALAGNRYYVDEDGLPVLDAGAFVAALEYASGRPATMLGKPAPEFFHLAVASMDMAPGDVAMIGDDAEFDVHAAMRAGLVGYLVHTGKWTPRDSGRFDPPPTAEFDDLRAAVRAVVADRAARC